MTQDLAGIRAFVPVRESGGFSAAAPFHVADDRIGSRALVPVPGDHLPEPMVLLAVYPHRRHLAGRVRALIEVLIGLFERNPPA